MGRSASEICTLSLIACLANAFACFLGAGPPKAGLETASAPFSVYRTAGPVGGERQCAWFGDRREGVLYFGQAAFWSEYRAGGEDPTADLRSSGPARVGRFDLRSESFLPALAVEEAAPGESRAGVWDVLVHPDGRVYFTSFFEGAGSIEPESGAVHRFSAAGTGLNELAWGPGETILASRYAAADGSGGSVVLLDPEGQVEWEHRLPAPPGTRLAPKTVAFDPVAREIWITTDLLPGSSRHPTLVIDLTGQERQRVEDVEVQFVRFEADGTGVAALVEDSRLLLKRFPAELVPRDLEAAKSVLLDASFPSQVDFVQDIQLARDGQVVVTRWSGVIHLVVPGQNGSADAVHTTRFPRLEAEGLYYSAFLEGERLCATYCAGVTIVCGPAPGLLR